MQTEINIVLGKNEGYMHMPSSLGSRLISVGRQAGRQAVSETKIFAIRQLQFSKF